MPAVSVIIPVFNGERFLRESLQSVFDQTWLDYEIICVDDGSTDGSLDLLKAYSDRVIIIRQANAGQGVARNVGVEKAKGRFIAFLDQDDRWYPHKLERQVVVLNTEPDVALVHCNTDRMDEEGRVLQRGVTLSEEASALKSPLGLLIGEVLILPSAMLVRRDVFQRIGGFDLELRGFEDFDLCARLKQQGSFVFLEEVGLCYRVHAGGYNRAGGIGVIRSRERFLNRMRDLYTGDRGRAALIRRMLADCYSDWGMYEARNGNSCGGWAKLIRSLQQNPWKIRTYSRLLRVPMSVLVRPRKRDTETAGR